MIIYQSCVKREQQRTLKNKQQCDPENSKEYSETTEESVNERKYKNFNLKTVFRIQEARLLESRNANFLSRV